MNASDWIQLTGSALAGRGRPGRPINLQRLVALAGKAARPTRSRHGAAYRRTEYLLALQNTPVAPSRRRARAATRSPSIYEQSQPGPAGAAARLRHNAIVQRYRKPF
jgi:hypothetical protein